MPERRVRPPNLELRLLGELEVRRNGRAVALPQSKKTRALLGYLTATRRAHSRAQLCELLWDGPDDPRGALRWSLTKIRSLLKDFEGAALVTDRDRVEFNPSGVAVDMVSVLDEVGTDPANASIEALRRSAERFRGEFLDGADLPGCFRYHEWWVAKRESLRGLHTRILVALVGRLREDPASALTFARSLVLIDPFSEAAHIAVIDLLGALGKTREALQQYESCRRVLESQLNARPSAALEQARMALGSSEPPPPRQIVASPATARIQPPPRLVGRDLERAEIARAAASARDGRASHMLLITGEPGIGKTRLLEEAAQQIRAVGGIILAGRAYDAERLRPYGAWIDALRSAPLGPASPMLRRDLAPLLPELGESATNSDRNRLFDAVARFLASLGEKGSPIGLLLDDVQWFDEASIALLHFVARALRESRVLIVCAARSGELADNRAALGLVRGLRRDDRLRQIPLSPLDADETQALVRTIKLGLDAVRVFNESEGNPLFALEIARALTSGERAISETLEGLLLDRLGLLDERSHTLVVWAAALGRRFSVDVLRAVSGVPVADLLGAMEDIERRGILRAAGSTETRGDYDFTHDLLRQAAYREISEPRRRIMHLQIARALAAMDDLEGGLAGDVAHHAALGGDRELAAHASVTAGERCLRLFAHREAFALAQRGLQHLSGLRLETRLRLNMALLKLAVHAGEEGRRMPDLDVQLSRVIGEARDAGLASEVATGFYLLSFLHHSVGDFSAALQDTLRGAEAARSADPATAARAFGNTGRCLVQIEREIPRAESLLLEAQAIAARVGVQLKDVPWGLGLVSSHYGRYEEAAVLLEQGLALARIEHDHWAECECLARLAINDLERGRPDLAEARCRELAPVAARMGDGSERPLAAALEALAHLAVGQADAESRLEHALDDLRRVDAKALLARALIFAASINLEGNRPDVARLRADEALRASEIVGNRTQIVMARALLGLVALRGDDRPAAAGHLDAARQQLAEPHAVTARARAAVLRLAESLAR